jgi:hypothetical protein
MLNFGMALLLMIGLYQGAGWLLELAIERGGQPQDH